MDVALGGGGLTQVASWEMKERLLVDLLFSPIGLPTEDLPPFFFAYCSYYHSTGGKWGEGVVVSMASISA